MIKNVKFIEIYGEMSKEQMMELFCKLTIPWIFLKDDTSGTIAYCDSDYMIEFSFAGDFETFYDFSIDSQAL